MTKDELAALADAEHRVWRGLEAAIRAHRDYFCKANGDGESRRHLASKVDFTLWENLEDEK